MSEFGNKRTLGNLLYKSYSKTNITHMDMFNKRTYHISDEDEFLKLYTNSYKYLSRTKDGFNRYLLERSTGDGPIIVDVDLSDTTGEPKPLYTSEFVLTLTRSFQKILREHLVDNVNLECLVLEKPGYFKNDVYKNGFHLHFPHVWLSESHRIYINKLVNKDTGVELDESVVRGNWFLYGSKKSPESDPYMVSYIIEEHRDHVPNTYSIQELVHILSVRVKSYTKLNDLKNVDESVITTVKDLTVHRDPINFNNHKKKTVRELRYYVKQLDVEVSTNYVSWRSVGCSLYNESHGSEPGRKLWYEFSSKCVSKYDKGSCDRFWDNEPRSSCSLGTIIHYIKEHNGGEYKRYEPSVKRVRWLSKVR